MKHLILAAIAACFLPFTGCSKGDIDCGKLVKDNASIYNGKGGGNKTLARAIFPKDEYISTFIDLIEKHLR